MTFDGGPAVYEVEVIVEKIVEVPIEVLIEVPINVFVVKPIFNEKIIEEEILVERNVFEIHHEEYSEEEEIHDERF